MFVTYIISFLGIVGGPPTLIKNDLRDQGKETSLRFLWWLGGVARESVLEPPITKKEALKPSYKFAQMWVRGGKKGVWFKSCQQ